MIINNFDKNNFDLVKCLENITKKPPSIVKDIECISRPVFTYDNILHYACLSKRGSAYICKYEYKEEKITRIFKQPKSKINTIKEIFVQNYDNKSVVISSDQTNELKKWNENKDFFNKQVPIDLLFMKNEVIPITFKLKECYLAAQSSDNSIVFIEKGLSHNKEKFRNVVLFPASDEVHRELYLKNMKYVNTLTWRHDGCHEGLFGSFTAKKKKNYLFKIKKDDLNKNFKIIKYEKFLFKEGKITQLLASESSNYFLAEITTNDSRSYCLIDLSDLDKKIKLIYNGNIANLIYKNGFIYASSSDENRVYIWDMEKLKNESNEFKYTRSFTLKQTHGKIVDLVLKSNIIGAVVDYVIEEEGGRKGAISFHEPKEGKPLTSLFLEGFPQPGTFDFKCKADQSKFILLAYRNTEEKTENCPNGQINLWQAK